tara:strand:+ start:3420 stop:4064 length:645 start_codon:yes stop_codon:yes gene_type:complete
MGLVILVTLITIDILVRVSSNIQEEKINAMIDSVSYHHELYEEEISKIALVEKDDPFNFFPENKKPSDTSLKKEPIKNNRIKKYVPVSKSEPEITLVSHDTSETKFVVPSYTLHRIEKLSGSFSQGKLYVTVHNNFTEDQLKLLCHTLKEKYNDFTNLVICLYSDNEIGISLALGRRPVANNLEIQKSWLVFYSYNPVEGEYFDTDPGRYLGTY